MLTTNNQIQDNAVGLRGDYNVWSDYDLSYVRASIPDSMRQLKNIMRSLGRALSEIESGKTPNITALILTACEVLDFAAPSKQDSINELIRKLRAEALERNKYLAELFIVS